MPEIRCAFSLPGFLNRTAARYNIVREPFLLEQLFEELMTYKPHILVVDDSETNRDLLSRILGNYRVSTVASVQGARTQLALDPPDVMLLDVMLPDVDGLTFLSELR
ncbi:MAG TPA: response regulator, partial [Chloroflexi bacterium]|nr:response regulator [Chloroflexota bacterium]